MPVARKESPTSKIFGLLLSVILTKVNVFEK